MRLAAALVALDALATCVAGTDHNPDQVVCETSDASPFVHHIDQLIENLRTTDKTNTCFMDNLGYTDDFCGPTIKDYSGKGGGAVFALCSGEINTRRPRGCAVGSPGKISCKDCEGWGRFEIARMLEAIRDHCKNPHRAGGIYYLRAPAREERRAGQVRLYTMPGLK